MDTQRASPRDVLRRPAGLDDTIGDLMWSIMMSDSVPPTQTIEVSLTVMNQIDNEIKKLDKLVDGSIDHLNKKVIEAGIQTISG